MGVGRAVSVDGDLVVPRARFASAPQQIWRSGDPRPRPVWRRAEEEAALCEDRWEGGNSRKERRRGQCSWSPCPGVREGVGEGQGFGAKSPTSNGDPWRAWQQGRDSV